MGSASPPTGPTTLPALRAAQLRGWVEDEARRAFNQPSYRAACGFAPACALPLLRPEIPTGSEAEWIRGAAHALLPRGTGYRIDEDRDGRAWLVILSFNGVPI